MCNIKPEKGKNENLRRAHVLFTLSGFVCSTCVVVLFCFSSSCVPYVASFFGLLIFYCLFGIL